MIYGLTALFATIDHQAIPRFFDAVFARHGSGRKNQPLNGILIGSIDRMNSRNMFFGDK